MTSVRDMNPASTREGWPIEISYRNTASGAPGADSIQVRFQRPCAPGPVPGRLPTGLRLLAPDGCSEVLRLARGGSPRWVDDVLELAGDRLAVLAIWVDESRHNGLEAATIYAYERLLDHADRLGLHHGVRVWNYIGAINEQEQGLERYRSFCIGRHHVFSRHQLDTSHFPAACALGHDGGDLLVYMLVSADKPRHFENPAQVSAYHYPKEYGPRSPSFARSSLLESPDGGALLFVSGTASVVGHETRYPRDLEGQLEITRDNLERLLAHVNENTRDRAPFRPELLKVYLRREADVHRARAFVNERFGPVPTVYVRADICRDDLLVEIDGLWRSGAE